MGAESIRKKGGEKIWVQVQNEGSFSGKSTSVVTDVMKEERFFQEKRKRERKNWTKGGKKSKNGRTLSAWEKTERRTVTFKAQTCKSSAEMCERGNRRVGRKDTKACVPDTPKDKRVKNASVRKTDATQEG